jgi:hypothetical protein
MGKLCWWQSNGFPFLNASGCSDSPRPGKQIREALTTPVRRAKRGRRPPPRTKEAPGAPADSERFRSTPRTSGRFRDILSVR